MFPARRPLRTRSRGRSREEGEGVSPYLLLLLLFQCVCHYFISHFPEHLFLLVNHIFLFDHVRRGEEGGEGGRSREEGEGEGRRREAGEGERGRRTGNNFK